MSCLILLILGLLLLFLALLLLDTSQSKMSFTQTIAFFFGRFLSVLLTLSCKGPSTSPLTSLTFTETIVISKEVFTVEAGYLFTSFNISQNSNTCCVSTSGNKLKNIMIESMMHDLIVIYYAPCS